jgi:CheY-like chemotaxis protein
MLVVEDEAMVAMLVEDLLGELGCIVAGMAGSLAQGLKLASPGGAEIDAAILDVNLGGEKVFPIADELAARGVPFVFATGYGIVVIDPRFSDRLVLAKPYQKAALERLLVKALL